MSRFRSAFIGLTAVALTMSLTACAAPSRIYAADKKEGVYFALPTGWKKISQGALAEQEAKSTVSGAAERASQVLWQEAYVVDPTFDAARVLSLKTPDSPIVYVRVRSLLPDEVNSISYNSLRDLVVPLTGWVNGTLKAPTFDIFADEERVEKGARGVHSIYAFTQVDGSSQQINQTSLLSNDHSIIYVLMIRCSATCYEKNRVQLEKIAASFTVRGK
jgi:hypothetical protein